MSDLSRHPLTPSRLTPKQRQAAATRLAREHDGPELAAALGVDLAEAHLDQCRCCRQPALTGGA